MAGDEQLNKEGSLPHREARRWSLSRRIRWSHKKNIICHPLQWYHCLLVHFWWLNNAFTDTSQPPSPSPLPVNDNCYNSKSIFMTFETRNLNLSITKPLNCKNDKSCGRTQLIYNTWTKLWTTRPCIDRVPYLYYQLKTIFSYLMQI